jgi:hypothetical protein
MTTRDCIVILVAGKKKVGKTYSTIQLLDDAVRGNIAAGIKPRKALIFDVNNEFSDFKFNGVQRRIKAIRISDIPRFSASNVIEIRRIAPFFDDGRKMGISDMQEVLAVIMDGLRNAILLVEDPNRYIGDNVGADIIGNLATVRHIGLDVICHFQQISRVGQPKLLGNANFIRYHKTNDTVSRHEAKFEEKTEMLQIAENIVNYFYNIKGYEEDEKYKYFYLWIDVDESKILAGNYPLTEEVIFRAIHEYIADNRNKLVKPILNRIDLASNKKIFTEATAIKYIADKIKKTYF